MAPVLEVKLGLGGSSYAEVVQALSLPPQLAEVDPIVASFCGGSVGVVSGLLLIEVNNIKRQIKNRCGGGGGGSAGGTEQHEGLRAIGSKDGGRHIRPHHRTHPTTPHHIAPSPIHHTQYCLAPSPSPILRVLLN